MAHSRRPSLWKEAGPTFNDGVPTGDQTLVSGFANSRMKLAQSAGLNMPTVNVRIHVKLTEIRALFP